MNPRVKSILPMPNFILEVVFRNDEKKRFDVKPYMNLGLFKELKDLSLFQTATAKSGTVVWDNGLDICPDTLYIEGK